MKMTTRHSPIQNYTLTIMLHLLMDLQLLFIYCFAVSQFVPFR